MPKLSTLFRGTMLLGVFLSFGFYWNTPESPSLFSAPPTELVMPTINNVMTTNPSDCDIADGIIVIEASGATDIEYSIDGGLLWRVGNTFQDLEAGRYRVVVRELGTTLLSDVMIVNLSTPTGPTIQSITINNTTACDASDGAIDVVATGGSGSYEFSIDNGLTWVASGSFSGLGSGAYQVAVRNNDGTCRVTGGLNNVVGDSSEPLIADIFVSAITDCGTANGIIVFIVQNASTDFEYSIDNGQTWAGMNSYALLSGGTYDLFARRVNGTCQVSAGTVILAEPPLPVINNIDSSDPSSCVSANGTITFDVAPYPLMLEYSIDGGLTWLQTNTFFNLMPGTYTPAVRNLNGNCVANGQTIQLTSSTLPSIDNVFTSDPTDCVANNGGIGVAATGCTANGVEYSIDNGQNWQSDGTFSNLSGGMYEVLVRNVGETETVTTGTLTLTTPVAAVIDDVATTTPDCSGAGGSITITATGNNGNLEYSVDGGNSWQIDNVFNNLIGGIYDIVVRFPASGCLTTGDQVTLTEDGSSLNITGAQTVNPGCAASVGSIAVIIVTGQTLEFTIDGGQNWQSANFFPNVPEGTYTPGARIAGGGCETFIDQVTIAATVEPDIQGVTFTDVSDCGGSDGTITVTATGGSGDLEYSIDGGMNWQATGNFADLPIGTYPVFVRNADESCTIQYSLNPVEISQPQNGPSIDDIQAIAPTTCGAANGRVVIISNSGNAEFSIDNGATFQSANVFANLPAGVYDIVLQTPGTTCQSSSTATVPESADCNTQNFPTDIVNVTINNTTEICLDNTILQSTGLLTDVSFCDQGELSTVFATEINNNCVTLNPADNFMGISPDTICTIHCYDNDNSLCDTTLIVVTVDGGTMGCPEVFGIDTLTVMQMGNPTAVCVPVPTVDAFSSNLFLNGATYSQQLAGCEEDTVVFYSYALLTGGGFDGPYELASWVVNGVMLTGNFSNAVELTTLMNTLDPSGMWTINTTLSTIESQNTTNNYGNMEINHVPSGNMTTLQTNLTAFPNGTIVNVTDLGINVFVIENPIDGCRDTLYINLEEMPVGGNPTASDTLVTTIINTPIDPIILDGSEIGGNISSVVLCELSANGGVGFPNNNSVVYNPNTNFIGKDTFCVQYCNSNVPPLCDTLNVVVCVLDTTTVINTTDTLFLNLPDDSVVDTCITSLIDLPNGIDNASICGLNQFEITASVQDDCVTLNPADGFTGQTEVCVLHCDASATCDTTYIIVNVGSMPPPPSGTIDTLFLNIGTDEIVDTCLTALIDLPNAIDTAFICALNPFEVTASVQEECVTLNPADGFTGDTEVCVVHCDAMMNCDTTIIIATVSMDPPPPSGALDTLFLNIGTDEIVDTCLTALIDLPNAIDTAFICALNPFEITASVQGECVTLNPADGFTGDTEVCVVHCDAMMNCDTTIIIATVGIDPPPPPSGTIDTLEVSLLTSTPLDTCLTALIDLDNPVDTAIICGLNPNLITASVQDDCITLNPAIGFMGEAEVCVVHCDSLMNCDTTIIIATISDMPPVGCDDFLPDTIINIESDLDTVLVCLPIAQTSLDTLDLFLDGQTYTGIQAVCDGDGTEIQVAGLGSHTFAVIDPDDDCSDSLTIVITEPMVDDMNDTIFVTITEGTINEPICGNGDELMGVPSNLGYCQIPANGAAPILNDSCVAYTPNIGFIGVDTFCLILCDDFVPATCDTFTVFVTVEPECDDIFTQDTITFFNPGSGLVDFCIDVPPSEILDYDLTFDGMPYTGGFMPCDIDSVWIYNFSLVPGMGNDGPYDVEWDAGFAEFTATIQTVQELVDSMNVWDPAGIWGYNSNANVVISDNEMGSYGVLMINQTASAVMSDLQPNFTGVPLGTAISFNGEDEHILIIEEVMTGCTDTVTLVPLPIIVIETEQDIPSDTICLDTTFIAGAFDTLMLCEAPMNGMISFFDNCFLYTPDSAYVGLDTACVMLCDTLNNCDSTLVYITVNQFCPEFPFLSNDTLNIELDSCPSTAAICLPISFDSLLANYTIFDNGAEYMNGLAGCDLDTCLNYSTFSVPDQGQNGPYTLNGWSVGDTIFMGAFQDVGALVDSMNFWNPVGWALDSLTGNIRACNLSATYGDLQITQDSSGQMALIDAVQDFFPNGVQINLDEGSHEVVFTDTNSGCTDTLLVAVTCPPMDTCVRALTDSFIFIEDCDDNGEFCLDILITDATNYQVTIGDTLFSSLSACSTDPDFVALLLPTGDHEIVFEDTTRMCSEVFNVRVTCEYFDDITIDTIVVEDGELDICLEDLEFPLSQIDSIINVCPDAATGNVDFTIDEMTGCINIFGDTLGVDSACFKVFLLDTCATVFVNVQVIGNCNIDVIDADNIGVSITDCGLNEGDICLPVPFAEFQNYNLNVGGTEYMGNVVGCDFDSVFTILYSQFPGDGNVGPYVINSWTINDSTYMGVVQDENELLDSLAVWDPGCNWEIMMNGNLTTIVGGCSGNSYGEQMLVEQELTPGVVDTIAINQNFFPFGTQITLEVGTFDLILTDSMGCFDQLTATVGCVESDTIPLTIELDSMAVFCIDSTDLIGTLVSIENICEELSGENVEFQITSDSCLTYTGVALGVDTACIVVCDDLGICDTTILIVTTITDTTDPPIAFDDEAISEEGQPPITIDLAANDINVETITDIFILIPPNFGEVEFVGDGAIQYVPNEGYCDDIVPDSFTYVICNPIGCDTATAFVTILCTGFEIFEGFSPNGDQINDTWVVRGIGNFDNHVVRIFNRWGNELYVSRSYHLEPWDGRWDGNDLPDGTYFYVIDLGDGTVEKGFLEIRR